MHLEQRSLIQVCDLSENQIPVISPAIWPCVCGPRTREDGPAAVQGAGSGCRAPASLPEHPHSINPSIPPSNAPSTTPSIAPSIPRAVVGRAEGVRGTHTGGTPCRNHPGEHFGDAPGCACARREAGPRGQPCRDSEEVDTQGLPCLGTWWQQGWPREAEEGPVPQQDPSSGRPRAAAWPGGLGGPRAPLPTPHSQLIKALPLF